MHPRIDSIPEELLEQILGHVLAPPPPDAPPRPSWHAYKSARPAPPPAASTPPRPARTAPLLVSRAWLRIATPLAYRHPALRDERRLALLLRTLRAHPDLGRCVRALRVDGVFDALADVAARCPELDALDITIDDGAVSTAPDAHEDAPPDVAAMNDKLLRFAAAFGRMPRLRSLVLRKTTYAYLTLPRTTLLFEKLAEAIPCWKSLHSIEIDFRFSPPTALAPFTAALARAPALRTVRTVLPSVWNPALLEISANASLERIELASETRITDAHLYLAEARKHPRLLELVRAGTPIVRPRAHTVAAERSRSPPVRVHAPEPEMPPPVPAPAHGRRGKLAPPPRHVPTGRRMSAV